jgi:hypothetical protein
VFHNCLQKKAFGFDEAFHVFIFLAVPEFGSFKSDKLKTQLFDDKIQNTLFSHVHNSNRATKLTNQFSKIIQAAFYLFLVIR